MCASTTAVRVAFVHVSDVTVRKKQNYQHECNSMLDRWIYEHKDSPHDGNWLYQIRLWQRRICPLASAKSVTTSPSVYVKSSVYGSSKCQRLRHHIFLGLCCPSHHFMLPPQSFARMRFKEHSLSVGSVYSHFWVLPGVICPNSS